MFVVCCWRQRRTVLLSCVCVSFVYSAVTKSYEPLREFQWNSPSNYWLCVGVVFICVIILLSAAGHVSNCPPRCHTGILAAFFWVAAGHGVNYNPEKLPLKAISVCGFPTFDAHTHTHTLGLACFYICWVTKRVLTTRWCATPPQS